MLNSIINSRNGGLIAAISGVILIYIVDCITKNRYSVHADKESVKLIPASTNTSDQMSVDTDQSNTTIDENATTNGG